MAKDKKNKKPAKRFSIWSLVITGILALLIGVGGTYAFMYKTLRDAQAVNTSMAKIQTVYQTLYYNYYRNVSSAKLEKGAIDGMLKALDDPFSEYMTKSEAKSLNNTISGSFVGIGIEVQKDGDYIKVIAPISKTPAAKAGLKAKDVITAIDGKSIKGLALEKVITKIRGKKGTSVTLTIKRGQNSFDKTIKRASIPVATIYSNLDADNKKVGYIRVTTFSTNTAKEFKQAVKKLRQKGAKSFIVDVRDNPGGLMTTALQMASMFVKNGKNIMQVQGRDKQVEVYKSSKEYSGGFKVTEPTVVLVNGGSASASEIFASALNESANIKLIGSTTYGKGTVQTTQEYKDGTELKLTIDKWLTANGQWINKVGIKPTIQANYPAVANLAAIDTSKTYSKGQVSKQIKSLQKMLAYLGYFNGQANGYYGDDMVAAVTKFQNDNKLTADGVANKQTVIQIETKLANKISAHDNAYEAGLKELNQK